MAPNRLSFALLAAGCLVAAAGGGYYAIRQSQPAAAAPAMAPATGTAATPAPVAAAQAPAAPAQSEAATADRGTAPARPAAPERSAPAAETHRTPVEKTASAEPAHHARRDRVAEHSEPARAPEPAKTAEYGPVAGSHPVAPNSWPVLEQGLPSGNPAPPALSAPSDPATAPADDTAQADSDLKPIEQYVISADSVIGLIIDSPLSSETARVEDAVQAHVSRDVKVGEKVAIPAGTEVRGVVVEVDHGGKFKDRARLGIRFDTIRMADGSELSIRTDTIFRDGDAPGDESTKKIGASAVAGTILGAIFGGARGALIGGATGAAGGTAMVEAGGRKPATFPEGATVTVRLRAPVTVTNEK